MTKTIEKKPVPQRKRRMAREPKSEIVAEVASSASAPKAEPKPAKPASKISLVLGMLERRKGATIEQMVAATSWLPHTTRAALTGLKKKGHKVTSEKIAGEERVYRAASS